MRLKKRLYFNPKTIVSFRKICIHISFILIQRINLKPELRIQFQTCNLCREIFSTHYFGNKHNILLTNFFLSSHLELFWSYLARAVVDVRRFNYICKVSISMSTNRVLKMGTFPLLPRPSEGKIGKEFFKKIGRKIMVSCLR